tara:strand:+ start:325 stop:579 length:255 start_codon:yes stop_codon:yes gene_type:complete
MPAQESMLQSLESDPPDDNNLNLSYTGREYQTSNTVVQDQKKEGILSFFQNLNYNEREVEPTTNTTQANQSTSMSPGSGTTGAY